MANHGWITSIGLTETRVRIDVKVEEEKKDAVESFAIVMEQTDAQDWEKVHAAIKERWEARLIFTEEQKKLRKSLLGKEFKL